MAGIPKRETEAATQRKQGPRAPGWLSVLKASRLRWEPTALAWHSVQTGQDGSLTHGPRHPLSEGSTERVTGNIGGVGHAPGFLLRCSQIPDGNVSSPHRSPFLSAFAPFPTNSREAGGPQLWENSGQCLERGKMPMQRSGCGTKKNETTKRSKKLGETKP